MQTFEPTHSSMLVQGDVHLGEDDDGILFEDSSGDLSDMLGSSIKLEHRSLKIM